MLFKRVLVHCIRDGDVDVGQKNGVKVRCLDKLILL